MPDGVTEDWVPQDVLVTPTDIPAMPETDEPEYNTYIPAIHTGWVCPECLAIVINAHVHNDWHRSLDKIVSRP